MDLIGSMDAQVDRVVNVIGRWVHRSVSGMDVGQRKQAQWQRLEEVYRAGVGSTGAGCCLITSPGHALGGEAELAGGRSGRSSSSTRCPPTCSKPRQTQRRLLNGVKWSVRLLAVKVILSNSGRTPIQAPR